MKQWLFRFRGKDRPPAPDTPNMEASDLPKRLPPIGVGYIQTVQTVMAINRGLLVISGTLTLCLGGAIGGILMSRDWVTVYLPPMPQAGGFVEAGSPGPAVVWGFASQILQGLNHWPHNGETDFQAAIERQAVYLTPSFRRTLEQDRRQLMNRFGVNELRGRSRALHPAPEFLYGPEQVRLLGSGAWSVDLQYRLVEAVETTPVKDAVVRYEVRVVQAEVDPERNIWGLQLDGFIRPPSRLDSEL